MTKPTEILVGDFLTSNPKDNFCIGIRVNSKDMVIDKCDPKSAVLVRYFYDKPLISWSIDTSLVYGPRIILNVRED